LQFEVPETEQQISVANLFYVHKHTQCPLSSKDALSMIIHIIENPDGGANLNLAKLVTKKRINVRVHASATRLHSAAILCLGTIRSVVAPP
jgi:hypothetical protein